MIFLFFREYKYTHEIAAAVVKHLGYVNYDLDYPAAIKFAPEGETLDAYRRDYNDNMVNGYISGEAVAFDALMERIKLLQQRFRDIDL